VVMGPLGTILTPQDRRERRPEEQSAYKG